MAEEARELSGVSFLRGLISFTLMTSQRPYLPIYHHVGEQGSTYDFWGMQIFGAQEWVSPTL